MKKNNQNFRSIAVLGVCVLTGVSLIGCAAETASENELAEFIEHEAALLPAGCTELNGPVNAHACSHGPAGPYDSKVADSNANFTGATPKFDAIHTYYTVTLPSVGGGVYRGTVKFTPATNDDHIVYVDPVVTVTVKDASNSVVSSQLTKPFSDCATYLDQYSVHELNTTSGPYKLTFEANTSTIKVLLEEVKPLRPTYYKDVDGDTYGPLLPSQRTACLPPAGYVVTRAGDCNDNNASMYPGSGCP